MGKKDPEQLNVDSRKIAEAIDSAKAAENTDDRDLAVAQLEDFWREPYLEAQGPFGKRGDPTGLIIYRGYIIDQWGDPAAVEMTNSVTKSFLSTTVGLAVDAKKIKSVNDTAATYMAPIEIYQQPNLYEPFNTAHNRQITWDDMLRQTGDWEGTLWGIPDWADRPEKTAKQAPPGSAKGSDHGPHRRLRHLVRFGLLTARNGKWENRQLISQSWIKNARTPTTANDTYGYMNWFLNTNNKLFPSAPKEAFAHIGNGRNIIFVDPEHDLVIVARWIISQAKMDNVIKAVEQAISTSSGQKLP